MTKVDIYPYARGDLLHDRNTYFYSAYHGEAFFDAWRGDRDAADGDKADGLSLDPTPTSELAQDLRARIAQAGDADAWSTLDRLVQRFEVTKRVHHAYRDTWRAVDPSAFQSVPGYVNLADLLADAHEQSGKLTYLNCLLKLLDTVSSFAAGLPKDWRVRVEGLIERERSFVTALRSRIDSTEIPDTGDLPAVTKPEGAQKSVTLLACDSARARAYMAALCHVEMPPQNIILMGDEAETDEACRSHRIWKGVFIPDLRPTVSDHARAFGVPVTRLEKRDVNTDAVREALARLETDLVVYAGVGGQIVSSATLEAGPRFLHMHSGYLPDYRGSTTLYYALLNRVAPGVSAINLDPGIDTGPILARMTYPVPYAGMDVDRDYDSSIRADLMCRVLADYPEPDRHIMQSHDHGETYYVIHPILKHIALLSLKEPSP